MMAQEHSVVRGKGSPLRYPTLVFLSQLHRLSAVLHIPLGNHWMGNLLCNRRKTDRATQFGCSSPSTRAKARQTFVTAVRRVIHLLKLRRRWAAYGRILQESPRKDLWTGLERRSGVLVRIRKAHVGPVRAAAIVGTRFHKPNPLFHKPKPYTPNYRRHGRFSDID